MVPGVKLPSKGRGVSLLTLLSAVFLVLKLTAIIDWSWAEVFSPLWLPLSVFGIIMGLSGIGSVMYYALVRLPRDYQRRRRANTVVQILRDYERDKERS